MSCAGKHIDNYQCAVASGPYRMRDACRHDIDFTRANDYRERADFEAHFTIQDEKSLVVGVKSRPGRLTNPFATL